MNLEVVMDAGSNPAIWNGTYAAFGSTIPKRRDHAQIVGKAPYNKKCWFLILYIKDLDTLHVAADRIFHGGGGTPRRFGGREGDERLAAFDLTRDWRIGGVVV